MLTPTIMMTMTACFLATAWHQATPKRLVSATTTMTTSSLDRKRLGDRRHLHPRNDRSSALWRVQQVQELAEEVASLVVVVVVVERSRWLRQLAWPSALTLARAASGQQQRSALALALVPALDRQQRC